MLQYDNSAFHYFAMSSLVFYLVPSWYKILSRLYKAFLSSDADIGAEVRTSSEKKKAEELKKSFKGINTLKSTGFLFNFCLTIVLSAVFVYICLCLQEHGDVNTFDPFSILDIDSGADAKVIKKAFRKMSLLWHPDKNKNNPQAPAKFMLINKAYEALTDPVAKENFELYGNPDGKQSLEVSIGLPSWLLDTDNRNVVLMVYLLIMVILIPVFVYKYYSDSSKFGEKDVMYDTYSWYHYTLSEHSIVKIMPEILAGSAEFRKRNIPTNSSDKEEIGKIMNQVRSQMQKPKYNHPVCVKGNVLLHAHLLRKTDELSEQNKEDLKYMLRNSNSLIEAMITVCKHQEWLQTALNCINFGQYVSQACWQRDSTLLQLPHFTEEEAKHAERGSKSAKSLSQYLALPDDQKKGMAHMTEEQKQDVMKCCSLIPDISVETKVFVDDDEDDKIYEGDLCTVQVIITRNNIKEGEKAGLIHAPRFPFPKQEAWWVLLGTKDGKIISVDKVTSPDKVVKHNIKFLAPRQGTYDFDLYVKSNAYLGLDTRMKVQLECLDSSELPEYVIHPDDAELDDEPTLFEEMLNANVEEDSDSDDDSDEEDSDSDEDDKKGATKTGKAIRELSAAEKKKIELREARKKAASGGDDDDDSDDDSDAEEVYAD